jgi:hypothetical protein
LAVDVTRGLLAFRADHADHGQGFAHNGAGTLFKAANATLVNTQTPPYGTFSVQLDYNSSNFDCTFVLGPKALNVLAGEILHIVIGMKARSGSSTPTSDVWIALGALGTGIAPPLLNSFNYWGLKWTTDGKVALYLGSNVAAGSLTLAGTSASSLGTSYEEWELIVGECGSDIHTVVRRNGTTEINVADTGGLKRAPFALGFGDANASALSAVLDIYHVYAAYEGESADLLKPTIRTLYPTGNSATHTGWTGEGDATDKWKNWDDTNGGTPDDATTYNWTDGGDIYTSTMSDLVAADVPYFVRLDGWHYISNTKNVWKAYARENATNLAITVPQATTAAAYFGWVGQQVIMDTAPDTTAWDETGVNALELGAQHISGSGTRQIRMTNLYAEVAVHADGDTDYGPMPDCPAAGTPATPSGQKPALMGLSVGIV